ncbi:hypothetical protein KAS50_06380, partial [bacterium]|nr:hypothetical protein [bacterium]
GDYRDGLFFDFANKGGKGYVLLNDLRDAVYGTEMTDENYRNLFSERAYIDEKHYGRVGRARSSVMLHNEMLDFRDRREVMKNSIPAEAYIYYRGAKPLQIMLSAASFRGDEGKTKYEIYYSFPFDELEFDKTENSKTSSFEESIIIKNLDSAPLYKNYDSYTLTYSKDTNLKKKSFIGQITFEIPPEKEASLAYINLISPVSERVGLAYYELEAKDYRGSSLMMSDIEFSYDIQRTNSTDRFTKNKLRIIPHTGGVLDKNENVFVYFEIYNLALDSDGDARYKIDYTIRKRNPLNSEKPRYFNSLGQEIINKKIKKKEVITTTQTETVRQKDTFNYLLFDMKGLSVGIYDMTINIKDLISGETTSSDYPFYLNKK